MWEESEEEDMHQGSTARFKPEMLRLRVTIYRPIAHYDDPMTCFWKVSLGSRLAFCLQIILYEIVSSPELCDIQSNYKFQHVSTCGFSHCGTTTKILC